uniref:Shieldin complex subunit 1 C-terminal domain-containing protein n=1 Tax=Cairina moschata TaxID=8855 RepID=A0A8C3C4S7_CAIMO
CTMPKYKINLCESVLRASLAEQRVKAALSSLLLVCQTHTELNNASLSSTYEHENTEDASIRKSLDGFYETYCKNGPGTADPTCEAASRCLSQKVSELANRGGSKYALRCLQMAQVVLNRDGCKIFPNYPTTACFSKPAEGEAVLEDTQRTPGLSDDVLQANVLCDV